MMYKFGFVDPGMRFVKDMIVDTPEVTWTLDAVRNGTVSAQAILTTGEPAVATLGSNFTIDWSGNLPRWRVEAVWVEAEGSPLQESPAEVKLRWVDYVPNDHGNIVGDPLLTAESLTLQEAETRAAWITLHTAATTKPGTYRLAVNLYRQEDWAAEEHIASCFVTVQVHDITLPKPSDYMFYLDLWQHHSLWASHYAIPRWSERHWAIIEAFAKELATAGQKAITVIASDAPWAGQGCWDVPADPFDFYEFNMIQVFRSQDGTLRCDFTVLDRLIETYEAVGIAQEIEIFGLFGAWQPRFGTPLTDYPDPIRVRLFDESRRSYDFIQTKAELGEYIRIIIQHLKTRGWYEKARFVADELRDRDRFDACLAFLRSIDPDMRLKIACNSTHVMDEFKDDILDWVPNLNCITTDSAVTSRLTREVKDRKGRMSWYVCWGPAYPNTLLHSPSYESRLIGWLTDWFDIDGFLRWAFGAWGPDIWNRPAWKFTGGDMFLVYPGADGKPMSSVRWEMLKQGIQEFEMLRMVRKKVDTIGLKDPDAKRRLESQLNDVISHVIRVDDLGKFRVNEKQPEDLYATDPRAYDRARNALIRMLLAISE